MVYEYSYRRRINRYRGKSGQSVNDRHLLCTPQYTLDDLFISPFTKKRRYDEDGNISYVPIQRNLSPTGINIVDEYLRYMASGKMNVTDFTKPRGLLTEEIGIVLFVLTGIRGLRFRQLYQIKFVDELLRYTDMSFAEIAKRTGLGTPYYMYICLRREYDMSATERRKYLRQRGDLGRYIF